MGSLIGIIAVVAAQLTPLPCAQWQKAWEKDERSPQDATLRSAAAFAESAGDVDEARALLRLLTQRSTDEAVRAEAFDALSSLKRGDSVPCRAPARRTVLLVVAEGSGIDAAARDALAHDVVEDLAKDAIDVAVAAEKDACKSDEKCWRKLLSDEDAVAAVVVVPTRVGPVTDVDVTVHGFVARHHARDDDTFPKASAAVVREFVDDASAGGVEEDGVSPVVGAVVVGSGVAVAVAGGAVALLEWPVRDDPTALQSDRDRANVTSVAGLVGVGVGVAVIVVGGALLATSP